MMVYSLIAEEERKKNGYSKSACFRMIGVSSSGYYSWLKRYEDKDGKRAQKKKELQDIQEKFRQIIRKLGFVPGKRTFRMHMWRDHGIKISIKKCARIMKIMNLIPNRPKKDAYKGQATHYHECCAKHNLVTQNFKIGPRRIILTDITYLYYGANRTPCYLCAFKDAFTNEILGYHVDSRMKVDLVKAAYEKMMAQYGDQIKTTECLVHSDQGSQYLATDFQRILSDDGFIQSMSDRGNSQDNAPMESFFGRMKTEALDIIALCPDISTVRELIDGYMDEYNHQRYQYSLAGLTPAEFYIYSTTGIYPLDNYFGVTSRELMSVSKLVEARLNKAREKAAKAREAARKKREERALLTSVPGIIARDQRILRREKRKWEESKEIAERQMEKLDKVYEGTKRAIRFYEGCPPEIKESLRNPNNWNQYPELGYVNEIGDLY